MGRGKPDVQFEDFDVHSLKHGLLCYPPQMQLMRDGYEHWHLVAPGIAVDDEWSTDDMTLMGQIGFDLKADDVVVEGLTTRALVSGGQMLDACLDAHAALARLGLCDPAQHGLVPVWLGGRIGRTYLHNEHTRRNEYMSFDYLGEECPAPTGLHPAWTHTGWGWFAAGANSGEPGTPYLVSSRFLSWEEDAGWEVCLVEGFAGEEDYRNVPSKMSAAWFDVAALQKMCHFVSSNSAAMIRAEVVRRAEVRRDAARVKVQADIDVHVSAIAAWNSNNDVPEEFTALSFQALQRAAEVLGVKVSPGWVTSAWHPVWVSSDARLPEVDLDYPSRAALCVHLTRRLGKPRRERLAEQFVVELRSLLGERMPFVAQLVNFDQSRRGLVITFDPEHVCAYPTVYGFGDAPPVFVQ